MNRAGLTLLEVVIASMILVIIIGFALDSLLTSTAIATKGSIVSDLEARGRIVTDFFREELLQARYVPHPSAPLPAGMTRFGIDPPGAGYHSTILAYQHPGKLDQNGQPTPAAQPVYGYRNPSAASEFRQDLVCVVRFEATEVLAESSGAAPTGVTQLANWGALPAYPALGARRVANLDINNDGDRNDVFVRGKLQRYIVSPTALVATEGMSSDFMLRVRATGEWNGNLDDVAAPVTDRPDSADDPIFRYVDERWPLAASITITDVNLVLEGRAVAVIAWHGNFDNRGKGFLIRRSTATVKWRNPQS
jgi:hypothetical protein